MKVTKIFEYEETPIVIRPAFISKIGFVCVIISYLCGWIYFADSYDLTTYFKRSGIRYLSRNFASKIDIIGVRRSAAIIVSFGGIVFLAFLTGFKYGSIPMQLFFGFLSLYCVYALFQIAAIVVCLKVIDA